jgi:hypothetical protein
MKSRSFFGRQVQKRHAVIEVTVFSPVFHSAIKDAQHFNLFGVDKVERGGGRARLVDLIDVDAQPRRWSGRAARPAPGY